jgi:hypothetical protein
MKSIVTPLFSKFTADEIKNHFAFRANCYLGIGRSLDFGGLSTEIQPIVFTTNRINEFYRNLVAVKKILAADMQVVLARKDWQIDSVYDAYEDDIELFSFNRFVNLGSVDANSNTRLSGTCSIFASNVVVGSNTSFSDFIFPGDQILVNSSIRTVVSITNNEHLIVNSPYVNINTNSSITLLQNSTIIVANNTNFIGNISPGNTIVIGAESKEVTSIRSNKVLSINTSISTSNLNIDLIRLDNTYPQYANNFYVRNSRDQVFKCLYNNNTSNSTIEPTIDIDGQLPENSFIRTADGYKWKYMYTIPPGLKQKFFTDLWMPVANDDAVVFSSSEGRIDIVNVLWGGSGHIGGGTSNTARILQVTNTDGANCNLIARVINGEIVETVILNGGNNYTTGVVTVIDNEKLGNTTLQGTVNVFGTVVSGNLSNTTFFTGNVFKNDIIIIDSQRKNVVSVIDNTTLSVNTAFVGQINTAIARIERSRAEFDIEFSPQNGHGYFPARELGARSLMFSVELEDDENSTLPVSDVINTFDFNQLSIIEDPVVANGAFYANNTNYRVATRVLVSDPGISNFVNDETVFVGPSVESASMVANVVHWKSEDNFLFINNITGSFNPSQLIRGETSGVVTTVLEIANSQIRLYSGEVLYLENRYNITRDEDQIEQVKIVLTF